MKKIYFVILFITAIYLFTISNTIFGGDSGDLVSAILTTGSAHPPGYPLYIILGIVFKSLPIFFLSSAGKVTLVSSFSTVASILLVCLIIKEIADKKYFNYYLAGLTGLIIGVNYLIWLYAIVPEVFPLNTFITLTIFYLSIKIYKYKRTGQCPVPTKSIYVLALFLGLGISHHQTFVLVLPSVIYLLYQKRKNIGIKSKELFKTAIFFIAGLLPLIYLIYTGFAQSAVLWGRTNTISGFFSTVLRMKYGTFVAAPIIQTSPQQRLGQINNLFNFIQDDFLLMGIIFFILCIIFYLTLKKSTPKTLLTALFINIFFFGPFFVFYANFPLLNGYFLATVERFLIVFYFFFAICLYFGLYYFINNIIKDFILDKFLHNIYLKKITIYVSILLLLLYPIGLFLKNFSIIYALKNDKTAENLGFDVLNSVPANSILILSSDNTTFDTQYVYYNQAKIRKDKILVHLGKFGFFDYINNLKANYPQLNINSNKKTKDVLTAFILNNVDHLQIYSENALNLPDLKGIEWIPQGIVFKLEKKGKSKKEQIIKTLDQFWSNSKNKNILSQLEKGDLKYKNLFTADILKIYAGSHKDTAIFFMNNNLPDKAYEHLIQAKTLEKDDPVYNTGNLFSRYFVMKGNCKEAEKEVETTLSQTVTIDSLKILNYIGLNCYKDEANKKRIGEKLKNYVLKQNVPLEKF